jgi:hypothetical protein
MVNINAFWRLKMRQTIGILSVLLGVLLFMGRTGDAQVLLLAPPAVTVSAGYSNLQTEKANNLFYTHDGSYLDADVAWQLPVIVPLQAGLGVTGSGYWERESLFPSVIDNFGDYYSHLYSDLGLFEIEPRIGLRLGGRTGFYALPRVGAGLLIDNFAIDQTFNSGGATYIDTHYHTGAGFEIRPAVQVGYSWGHLSAGLEGSYLYSWGDFGGLGHNAQELRIGVFLNFRF